MKKIIFFFRYALKSISKNIVNSLSLFLMILTISFLTLLTFNIKNIFDATLLSDVRKQNLYSDIVITPDNENGDFIISTLKLDNLYDKFENAYYEFNMPLAVFIGEEEKFNVENIVGIDQESFNYITNNNIPWIGPRECIVTNEFLENNNLQIGDSILIRINKDKISFQIKDIVSSSFMTEDKIFVQRTALIKCYSKEQLGIDISSFTNVDLATRVLLDLKNGVDKNELINVLKEEGYYKYSIVKDGDDFSSYSGNSATLFGIVYGAYSLFVLALLFVLVSFVRIRIERNKNSIGIIESLGGNRVLYYSTITFETLIYSLISPFISIAATSIIYNIAILNRFGFDVPYIYEFIPLLLSFLIPFLSSLLGLFISAFKYMKIGTNELSKDSKQEGVIKLKTLTIILLSILLITLIYGLSFKRILDDKYYYITLLFLIVVILCLATPLLIKGISLLFKNKSVFSMVELKLLNKSRIRVVSTITFILSFVGIILSFSIISTLDHNQEKIKHFGNIEYAIYNVHNSKKALEDISKYECVESCDMASYKIRVSTLNGDSGFNAIASFDIDKDSTYLDFSIPLAYRDEFKRSDKNYCFLSNNKIKEGKYIAGDLIKIKMSDKILTYTVLGGVDTSNDIFIFTNDYYTNQLESNTMIIKTRFNNEKEKEDFVNDLYLNYSSDLSIVLDVRGALYDITESNQKYFKIGYLVIMCVVFAFALSIINNSVILFNSNKKTYARLSSIGLSDKSIRIQFIKEALLVLVITIIPTAVITCFLTKWFGYVSVLFGTYSEIHYSFNSIFGGIIFALFTYIIGNSYYFIGYNKINIAQELKL